MNVMTLCNMMKHVFLLLFLYLGYDSQTIWRESSHIKKTVNRDKTTLPSSFVELPPSDMQKVR